jgi:hypothetical protein
MIGAILKEILGLFVDDEILAIGVFAIVSFAAVIALTQLQSIAALILVIGLPAVLIADVVLTVGQSTRK